MARELKFRICYTAQNGQKSVIYSSDRYLIGLNGEVYENYGKSWGEPFWETVFDTWEPPIIQQFTGLKDKNGKEIYEGDIVKYPRDTPSINTHYDISVVEFQGDWLYNLKSGFIVGGDYADENNTEIVGNIFENPELLIICCPQT